MMRFQNIALSLLSLKFPPGGQTNILLFGDPDPASTNSTLGWYVAYKKDAPPAGQNQSAISRRLGAVAGLTEGGEE